MFKAATHRRIYLVLLTLLGGFMVTTVGLSNVVWVLLLVNWCFEGRWKEKWQMARESRLLQAFAALFLLHAVALLWTSDLIAGLDNLRDMLPLMAVPLVLLTTPPPEGRTRHIILTLYILTVLGVSLIGFVRWLTIPDLPHREIVTYISHIRFSLNVCMVIFLLVFHNHWSTAPSTSQPQYSNFPLPTSHFPLSTFRFPLSTFHFPLSTFRFLLILWFLFFLLLLRSYTAFAILVVTSLAAILLMRRRRWLVVWSLGVGLVALMVVLGCRSYYRLVPLASEPLRECTAAGRPYLHKQDGLIENGNYVNNYLCIDELEREWRRRSAVPLDSLTASGYSVESALIRYLNALGLTKDSVGVTALTDSQVDEIATGVANPVYAHASPMKKMLYVTLFEYENYRCYHAVIGFTMLQRLELWKCAWRVIQKHPWLGTGTGDLHDDMHIEFVAMDSPMLQNELFPHNEYLTLMAMFGLLGFALTAFFFLRALHPKHSSNQTIKQSSNQTLKQSSNQTLKRSSNQTLKRSSNQTLPLLWLITILLSFLTENTLDSLAGILFCTWFLAFRQPDAQ